ncbi:MAG: Serine/threonine protein kinase with repeat, partial [Verrucomicrobiales bacterium]|nr:Serine/threonine protein kinase with repeat [Verrucomicrobiales bacterium]
MAGPIHIPDHTLLRIIGKGSYGEVWLAKSVMGTYRAVKIVFRDRFRDARPFERELQGIKKFEPISRSHEGFIDILHIGTNLEQGFFYYVMEIGDDVAGAGVVDPETYTCKTPEQTIQAHERLSVQECTELGLLLTAALSSLHKHDLVHRDIKPANILYVHGVPKLADIGLVAQTSSQSSIVGTIGYMPPEGPGTPQADIYSLGKVLYELLTGNDRQLFPNIPPELLDVDETEELVELNEILVKACHPDPKERYLDAWDMHAELTALTNGKSIKRLRFLENKVKILKRGFVATTAVILTLAALGFAYARELYYRGEAKQREIGAKTSLGSEKLFEGDYSQAMKYFLEAKAETQKPTANDEFRIRAIYQQTPKVKNLWFRNAEKMQGAFHPHLDKLVLGYSNGGLEILDLENPFQQPKKFDLSSLIENVAFGSSGEVIVTSSKNKGAELWSFATQALLDKVTGTPEWVHDAQVSPDGLRVVVSGADNIARMVSLHRHDHPLEFKGHKNEVTAAHFSHDGKLIITASHDGTVRLYNANSGEFIRATKPQSSWLYTVEFNHDDTLFVTSGADKTCRLFRTANAEEVFTPILHKDMVMSACFSRDERWIVVACLDSTIRFYDFKTGRAADLNPILYHTDRVGGMGFNEEGNLLFSVCSDGSVRVWDLAAIQTSGERLFISPNGRSLSFDSTQDESKLNKNNVKISPSGKYLVRILEGPNLPQAELYSMKSGVKISEIGLLSTNLEKLTFSEDDKLIASSSSHEFHVFTPSGRTISRVVAGNDEYFDNVFLSSDGREAVTSASSNFKVWDLKKGNIRLNNLKASQEVQAVAWTSRYVVVAGRDGWFSKCSARVFDRKTGKLRADLWHTDGVLVVRFSE